MDLRLLGPMAILLVGCAATPSPSRSRTPRPTMSIGADISQLPTLEAHGARFTADGVAGDALTLLRDVGFTAVRLRVWHRPGEGDLARTVALARRARAAGLDLLLDLHYSDTWADPGHQSKPAVWRLATFDALCDSVFVHSRDVVATLREAGAAPTVVQLGNEITAGMLFNDGRVDGRFDTPGQWDKLVRLLQAGREGVLASSPHTQILLHLDRGGDADGAAQFLDHLVERSFEFDMIGLSFYPWWHGNLDDLERTLATCARRYGKPIIVVETAYPWTLQWFDDTHNTVGLPSQLLPGYPASPAGQAAFCQDLARVVRRTPRKLGVGIFYWAPEWIAVPGADSPWENITLFDAEGALLPTARALVSGSRRRGP
jgi:arabinogalactan endo-1,4-beta-galactosidase